MLQLRVFLGRKCRIYTLFFVANIAITRFLGWNFWQKFVRNSQKYSEFWQKFWGKNWPLEPLSWCDLIIVNTSCTPDKKNLQKCMEIWQVCYLIIQYKLVNLADFRPRIGQELNMSDKKAVIKNADMSEEMQQVKKNQPALFKLLEYFQITTWLLYPRMQWTVQLKP